MSERICVVVSRDDTRITIGPPSNGGVGEWLAVAANVFLVSLIAAVVIDTVRHSRDGDFMNVYALPLAMTAVGVVMSTAFLLQVVALLWKLKGVERVVIDARRVSRTRRLGFVRVQRDLELSSVSNIRWREKRVVGKGRSHVRRVVSLDSQGKTYELGTNLLLVEATTLTREVEEAVARALQSPDRDVGSSSTTLL